MNTDNYYIQKNKILKTIRSYDLTKHTKLRNHFNTFLVEVEKLIECTNTK